MSLADAGKSDVFDNASCLDGRVGGKARTATERQSQTHWAAARAAEVPATVSLDGRMDLLRKFGDFSVAYSTATQPLLEYVGDEHGFIAFRRRWGLAFALGDPVCAPDRREKLIGKFLDEQPKATFVQCSEATAEVLESKRYRINEIGTDTRLDLGEWTFGGKQREWLRYADNWMTRRGYEIREGSFVENPAAIEHVSESWRKTRTVKRKEVRFLNRPIVLEDEPGVRRFMLYDSDGVLQAFVLFDPLYKDGAVTGYVTCMKRRMPDVPQYAEPAIMKRAIEVFQAEGIPSVWLGLSPLADIQNDRFRTNRMLHWTTRYYHRAGWVNRYFYNFLGHTQFKKRFRGEEHRVFYASPVRWNTRRLLALSSLCGVI